MPLIQRGKPPKEYMPGPIVDSHGISTAHERQPTTAYRDGICYAEKLGDQTRVTFQSSAPIHKRAQAYIPRPGITGSYAYGRPSRGAREAQVREDSIEREIQREPRARHQHRRFDSPNDRGEAAYSPASDYRTHGAFDDHKASPIALVRLGSGWVEAEEESDDQSDSYEFGESLKGKLFVDDLLRVPSSGTTSLSGNVPPPADRSMYHQTIREILRSNYRGDSYEGDLVADLTVQDVHVEHRRTSGGLFRWIHLKNPVLHFNAFQEYAVGHSALNGTEKTDVRRLLERIRKKFERPLPQGLNGRYMEPNLAQDVYYEDGDSKNCKSRRVLAMCIPFFSLEEYKARKLPDKSSGHPLRSLLQSRYSSIGKERDMQQVVCKLGSAPKGHCFHVSQMWCLVVGDHLFLTCARMPDGTLSKESVRFVPAQPPGDPSQEKPRLLVTDNARHVWVLDPEKCKSWFEFTASFLEFSPTFEEDYDVLCKGVCMNSDLWPKVIHEAKKTTVRLSICAKTRRRIPEDLSMDSEDSSGPISADASYPPEANSEHSPGPISANTSYPSEASYSPPRTPRSFRPDRGPGIDRRDLFRSPNSPTFRIAEGANDNFRPRPDYRNRSPSPPSPARNDRDTSSGDQPLYQALPPAPLYSTMVDAAIVSSLPLLELEGLVHDGLEDSPGSYRLPGRVSADRLQLLILRTNELRQHYDDNNEADRSSVKDSTDIQKLTDYMVIDDGGRRGVRFVSVDRDRPSNALVQYGAQIYETLCVGSKEWIKRYAISGCHIVRCARPNTYIQDMEPHEATLDSQQRCERKHMAYFPFKSRGGKTVIRVGRVNNSLKELAQNMETFRKALGRAWELKARPLLAAPSITNFDDDFFGRDNLRIIHDSRTQTGSHDRGKRTRVPIIKEPGQGSRPPQKVAFARGLTTDDDEESVFKFRLLSWLAAADDGDRSQGKQPSKLRSKRGEANVSRAFGVDEKKIHTILEDVHTFLSGQENARERKIYMKSTEASKEELDETIRTFKHDTRSDPRFKDVYKVIITVRDILDCFLPLEMDSVTLRKCFGSLKRMKETAVLRIHGYVMTSWELKILRRELKEIERQLSGNGAPQSWTAKSREAASQQFIRGWIRFVMAVVMAMSQHSRSYVDRHLSKCTKSIKEGLVMVRKSVNTNSLLEKEAVMPCGVLSLIVARITEDVTGDHPDILTTYWTYYLDRLEIEVREDSLNRKHQEEINHLTQEVDAIIAVLEDQLRVVSDLAHVVANTETKNAKSRLNPWVGRESDVLDQCVSSTVSRINSFKELHARATELGNWNIQMIDSNKDQQEAAIFAFTVVTVIFLPLSFVASFLGMNTSDIRDMGSNQWVYWAAAIPLTAVVIGLSLSWIGDFSSWREVLKLPWGKRRVPATLPPQPPAYEDVFKPRMRRSF
ncbi:hypothetical protein AJ80_07981 [Polytolypa hystricis UAMH7299]|uniref:Uncharacterized protein n=1 Tax=Polytolypa hystricis (strain UAMH7299) TaxID=1447883 RepID=A0A2B7XFV8_POLH7|nr:hypothetical protein AJ80_07981 [Polytolypa hystricis UAMH7299]